MAKIKPLKHGTGGLTMSKYKCICDFSVNKVNEDGFSDGGYEFIEKGEVFEFDTSTYRIVNGEIRLENDNHWIEIPKDNFKKYFVEIGDDGNA